MADQEKNSADRTLKLVCYRAIRMIAAALAKNLGLSKMRCPHCGEYLD